MTKNDYIKKLTELTNDICNRYGVEFSSDKLQRFLDRGEFHNNGTEECEDFVLYNDKHSSELDVILALVCVYIEREKFPINLDYALAVLFKSNRELYTKLLSSELGDLMRNNDYTDVDSYISSCECTVYNILYGKIFMDCLPDMLKANNVSVHDSKLIRKAIRTVLRSKKLMNEISDGLDIEPDSVSYVIKLRDLFI